MPGEGKVKEMQNVYRLFRFVLASASIVFGVIACRPIIANLLARLDTVHERLILPHGFMGTVFVIYNSSSIASAPPEGKNRTIDHLIDSSGIYTSPFSEPNAVAIRVTAEYIDAKGVIEFVADINSCLIDDPIPRDPTILCAEGIPGGAQNLRAFTVTKYSNRLAARSETFRKKIAYVDRLTQK